MPKDGANSITRLKIWVALATVTWTLFHFVVLLFYRGSEQRVIHLLGQELGRAIIQQDLTYRAWNAQNGGVYVPITEITSPNPYLKEIPNRDIFTNTGQRLTLINPAYMTRQVHELGKERYNTHGHLTSLTPIRLENKADTWETKVLKQFEQGKVDIVSEQVYIENTPFIRVMLPVKTEAYCLKCHAAQGYKIGDIRGGLSTAVSLVSVRETVKDNTLKVYVFHLSTYLAGLLGIALFYTLNQRHIIAREGLITEWHEALSEIKTLKEIMPICSHCKKIRDDEGYWQRLEEYITERTDSSFSHSICPDCMKEHYPQYSPPNTP